MNNVIEIKNVSFAYPGGVDAVIDVDLAIPDGEFAAIIGPNGGGKTTLLNLILGELTPRRGHVTVLGGRPEKTRRAIGYMPQHSQLDPQFPVGVMDVVLMGLAERHWCGPYSNRDRRTASEKLELIGIADLAKRSFSELSGGQRQRALIARALVSEPEILLLDEPTANIDPGVEERFYETLKRLNETITVVVVSHDLGLVNHGIDSVICVNRRVNVHPTSDLTGEAINKIYGAEQRLIRHDHRCAGEGHTHVGIR